MKKPVPPSNFQTRDFLTRVDLDRFRRGYQELLDWIAYEGKSYLTAASLAAYDTIAGNNGRYLLRAAADFVTFTHKASPVATDKVLLEDSANSGAKVYAALSELAAAVGASGANTTSEFWAAPATPNANDYEATSTTLPASWTLWNVTSAPAVAATPLSGVNVDTNAAAGTCRVEANRSARRSWVMFQASRGTNDYWFYATQITLSGTAGWVLRSRLATQTSPSTPITNNAGDFRLYVAKDNGSGTPVFQGTPGFATDGINIGWENDAGTSQLKAYVHAGGVVTNIFTGTDFHTQYGSIGDFEVAMRLRPGAVGSNLWDFWVISPTYTYFMGTSTAGSGTGIATGNVVWVGWYFAAIDNSYPGPIMRADYMRFENTTANFLP